MPAVDSLTPIIANIHYDDLARQFILRISEELKQITGNKREQDSFDLATLADVFLKIMEIWALLGSDSVAVLRFDVGNVPGLIVKLQDFADNPRSPVYETLPDPYVDDSAWDGTGWVAPTDWGETP